MNTKPSTFWEGFRAVLPLWLGSAPFAIAYAAAAQQAGWHAVDIQLMSLTVYSAPAQLGAIQTLAAGQPIIMALVTAVVVNMHQALYGLSISQRMRLSRAERVVSAYLLTDTAYGVTVAAGTRANFAFLLGAEVSLFIVWNAFTAVGLLMGQFVRIPAWAHAEFVSPLMFLVLLVATVKARTELVVAMAAVLITLMCVAAGVGSATIVVGSITAALLGAGVLPAQAKQTI